MRPEDDVAPEHSSHASATIGPAAGGDAMSQRPRLSRLLGMIDSGL
jgi:hypothetical protein